MPCEQGDACFIPDPGLHRVATFRYLAADSDNATDDAVVSMLFLPTSDAPPVAVNDEATGFEDVALVLPSAILLSNDVDVDGDPMRITDVAMAFGFNGRGSVELNDDGDVVFTPELNQSGLARITYTVTDDRHGSDSATVSINILPQDDTPTAGDDEATGSFGLPLVVRISDLLANDSDVDLPEVLWDTLAFAGIAGTEDGTAEVYGDEFVVVRYDEGFSGESRFRYLVEDDTELTDEGRVDVTVTSVFEATVTGTAMRDLLFGGAEDRTVEGGAGEDDIFGEGGNDLLIGGDDADRLDGGAGIDLASFAGSNVGVRADLQTGIGQGGHAQGDRFFGIEGLVGSDWNDDLYGDTGSNTLRGGDGNDSLEGRGGDDSLHGEDGDDILLGGLGADLIDGGEDTDTADYSDSGAGVTVSLDAGTAAGGDAEGDTLVSIENLIGSRFDDRLTGDGWANTLNGGRGDDVLEGLGGDDVLIGGRGGDDLFGGAGTDTASYLTSDVGIVIDMQNGAASSGEAEGDTFSSIEIVEGSFHDDTIRGTAGDNTLIGGRGADVLDGRGGTDTVSFADASEGVTVDLGAGTGSAGEADGDSYISIEALIGSVWDDDFTGSAADERFDGGRGDDTMRGAAGSDDYVKDLRTGEDRIEEQGDAGDIDRVLMGEGIGPGASADPSRLATLTDTGLVWNRDARDSGMRCGPLFFVPCFCHFAGP